MKKTDFYYLRFFILVMTFCILFGIGNISAVNVGVSPASINFKDVLRDGYAEDNIVVSVDSEEETEIEIEVRGEIEEWLNFETNFSVSRNSPYSMTISVTPPNDVPNGNYSGFVTIKAAPQGDVLEGHAVGIIRSVLDIYVTVEITDLEIIRCFASDYSATTVEQGDDIIFRTNVTNIGNVRLRPDMVIDIWNEDQSDIVKTISSKGNEVLPTTEREMEIRVDSDDLEISQYWAEFSVLDCLSSNLLTFDVLEEGALKADGKLLNILTINEARVGDTIPIEANFKNLGEKEVIAQFRGQITKAGRIIQVLESPKVTSRIGEINQFNFFFTPRTTGDYLVSGRIFYSSKRTFELSTHINILGSPFFSFILPVIYGALVILIMVLFLKIRKERRKNFKLLRKLK